MPELYIGLMSGTSVDGIDVALVDFSQKKPKFIEGYYQPYEDNLREEILSLCQNGPNEIERMGILDIKLGKAFAKAINHLLQQYEVDPHTIIAIGSHGQTIRHIPENHFTLQIGDPNVVAAETGIKTVADFRRKDMALGGQGAPLVPAFHSAVFADKNTDRCIVNLGGIANITLLPKTGEVFGFDTGPANTLLDAWIYKHLQQQVDKDGEWAALGRVDDSLLHILLSDPFFLKPHPKSTGREYFNLKWLEKRINKPIAPEDVQATLVDLTARSVMDAIKTYLEAGEVFVCGGGVSNKLLLSRLKHYGQNLKIESTAQLGIAPNWVEAIAFAWLAKQRLENKPGNLPEVTGAKTPCVLGGFYQ